MAKRTFSLASWTTTAVADTVAMTGGGYAAMQGGSATQRTKIQEVYLGGQSTASSPAYMTLARDSTVGVTPTALTTGQYDGPNDPATAALAAPVVPFTTASTQPQRAASVGRLNFSFNAFGGVVRWVAAPDEEFWILGNTASNGEVSLSAYTGGGGSVLGSHIIYESL